MCAIGVMRAKVKGVNGVMCVIRVMHAINVMGAIGVLGVIGESHAEGALNLRSLPTLLNCTSQHTIAAK